VLRGLAAAAGRVAGRNVTGLPTAPSVCSESTVNRKLSAVSAFYEFQQRHGVDLGDLLVTWQRRGAPGASWRPLYAHSGSRPERTRRIGLRAKRRISGTLDGEQGAVIMSACDRLRDLVLVHIARREPVAGR
jgi:integrase/recombinase XerD